LRISREDSAKKDGKTIFQSSDLPLRIQAWHLINNNREIIIGESENNRSGIQKYRRAGDSSHAREGK